MPPGLPGTGLPNHSRLIPGAPPLPNMTPQAGSAGNMLGMPNSLPVSSLLGREVSQAPTSAVAHQLQTNGLPSLSLGGALGHDPASAAPVTPIPAGRNIASLRTPRGTNFIRLAFAAVFLLGFLGLVGYLLKDYLPGVLTSLAGHDSAEEVSKEDPGIPTQATAPLASNPAPSASSKPVIAEKSAPLPEAKTTQPPITVGFDPQEPAAPKAATSAPGAVAAMGNDRASSTSSTPSPVPVIPTPPAPSASSLLEVPAKPAMNADSAGSPASSTTNPAQSHVIEEEDIPPAAKPAVEALKKFLASRSLAERLPYTLGADLMKPLMERYYARSTDGPIMVDRIQFVRMDPNPELGSGKHCILSLENKTWEFSVPVMLEEKADGFKVDWVSFVEFKDRMLEKFFQTYQEGKACFHVGIIRHHYFEDGVPNLDHKDAFRVSPAPPNSFQASVFLDKDSELAQELRSRMPWETHVWAVVELEWKKLGSQQWVELSAVPQMHWYSLPMSPKPISMPQKATVEGEDLPPGISKNGKSGKSSGQPAEPPPGIRKSSPDIPPTIRRPLPAGR